jgi:hypothetical protein
MNEVDTTRIPPPALCPVGRRRRRAGADVCSVLQHRIDPPSGYAPSFVPGKDASCTTIPCPDPNYQPPGAVPTPNPYAALTLNRLYVSMWLAWDWAGRVDVVCRVVRDS